MFFKKKLMAALGLMLCVASPAVALDVEDVLSYDIGVGATYNFVAGQSGSSAQKVHYVEYEPNDELVPIVAYGIGFQGKSSIEWVQSVLIAQGYNVVAGFNADFFDTTTGIPVGLVVTDGRFVSSYGNQYAIGFKADGTAIIGSAKTTVTLSNDDKSVLVENYNKTRASYTVCLYDETWGTSTTADTLGTNIVLQILEPEDCEYDEDGNVIMPIPTINGTMQVEVIDVIETDQGVAIGENQMVLSLAATGDATKISMLEIGDELTLNIQAEDEEWAEVVYGVGGKTLIVEGVVDTTGTPTGSAGRTSIGVTEDGTVIFYEVDGRQSDLSVGMEAEEVAAELLAMGVVNAINLDGGGSSVASIQIPGTLASTVQSSPSDGSLRKCSNYVFLVNTLEADGEIDMFSIMPETHYVYTGSKIALTVGAVDENYFPVAVPDNVEYYVDDDLGEFLVIDENYEYSDLTSVTTHYFVAGDTAGTAEISVEYEKADGEQNVYIIDTVDEFSLAVNGKTVTSLTASKGATYDFDAVATYLKTDVALDDEVVIWEIAGNIGTIDEAGVYTVGGSDLTGAIRGTLGDKSVEITVTRGDIDVPPTVRLIAEPEELILGETWEYQFKVTAGSTVYFLDEDQFELSFDGKNVEVAADLATVNVDDDIENVEADDVDADDVDVEEDDVEEEVDVVVENVEQQKVEYVYDKTSGILTVTLANVSSGYHKLTLVATDDLAAKGRLSVEVIVDGDNLDITEKFSDVAATAWSVPYIDFISDVGLMNGSLDDKGYMAFFPSRNLTRAEFAVIVSRYLGLQTYSDVAVPYVDIDESPAWAVPSIAAVYDAGLMMGTEVAGETYFNPTDSITRQEAMTVISRFIGDGYVYDAGVYLDSVDISAWAADHIDKLVYLGLVGGYEDGSILPKNNITRAEMAKIFYNLY